jgi:hypothetical protein
VWWFEALFMAIKDEKIFLGPKAMVEVLIGIHYFLIGGLDLGH